MSKTIQFHLLEKYNNRLTGKEVNLLLQNLGINPNTTNWDEQVVSGMADIMLEAKNNNELEEESVFDNEYSEPIQKRDSKTILKEILSNCSDETKFKIICNKLYKFSKGYLSDPKNPLNTFVAIMAEDYDSNPIVMSLIDELCEKHQLITELKPKGILVKANPAIFSGQYEALKTILIQFKDESLGIGGDTRSKKQKILSKAGRKNGTTNERVQAMREAQ